MKKRYIIFISILLFVISIFIPVVALSKNKYKILIDVEFNKLHLFEGDTCVKTYDICSGKYSTPSPLGTFTIIHKDTWGEGFGGSWMGFNVPWGKYGIHGTIEPHTIGSAASHGCIRMRNKEVKELYNIVPHGTKVTISGNGYGAFHYGLKTLKPGAIGSDVQEIQKRLKLLGYFSGSTNGRFDSNLEHAIKKFQKAKKLPVRAQIGSLEYKTLGITLMD